MIRLWCWWKLVENMEIVIESPKTCSAVPKVTNTGEPLLPFGDRPRLPFEKVLVGRTRRVARCCNLRDLRSTGSCVSFAVCVFAFFVFRCFSFAHIWSFARRNVQMHWHRTQFLYDFCAYPWRFKTQTPMDWTQTWFFPQQEGLWSTKEGGDVQFQLQVPWQSLTMVLTIGSPRFTHRLLARHAFPVQGCTGQTFPESDVYFLKMFWTAATNPLAMFWMDHGLHMDYNGPTSLRTVRVPQISRSAWG